MDKLARVLFLLLCHVTSIIKQAVFYTDAANIDQMIAGLDGHFINYYHFIIHIADEKTYYLIVTDCRRPWKPATPMKSQVC